jgi:hypothetical protein
MAFQQNAFQHDALQVGIAGAAPPAEAPQRNRIWTEPNPWKYKPTLVFEQQDLLNFTLRVAVQVRDPFFAHRAKTVSNQDFIGQNLLLTTLVVTAESPPSGEQLFDNSFPFSKSRDDFFQQNTLATILSFVAGLPEGKQSYPDSLWKYKPTIVFEDQDKHLTLFNPGFPAGRQEFGDVLWKNKPTQVFEQQNLLSTILSQVVVFPVGTQLFDAKLWKNKPTIVFEDQDKHLTLFNPGFPKGTQVFDSFFPKNKPTIVFEAQDLLNTLLTQAVVFPVGQQLFDSVLDKYKTEQVWYDQNSNLTLFNPGFPVGSQEFADKLAKFQTSTYFEYQDLLNTVLTPGTPGTPPTLLFDITTGRLALVLVDTTNPKIIMLL